MTSQSPATEGEATPEYTNAWASIRAMALDGNASWSGRERNVVFMNLGGREFANVSSVSGVDFIDDSRAVATVDWDDDGRLDLLLKNRTAPRLRFLRNQGGEGTHFLKFDLRGVDCNRDGIGATVLVELDGMNLRKTLHAGEGYISQSSKRLHFGLGTHASVQSVKVQWPGGELESFEGTAVDGRYLLVQGAGQAAAVEARTHAALAELPSTPARAAEGPVSRIVLVDRLPLEPVVLPAFDQPRRKVKDFAGQPLLVNLWESTCAVCLSEFGDFRERKEDLAASGLQLVTLAVDEGPTLGKARKIVENFGLAEGAGYVDDVLSETLEVVIVEVFGKSGDFELPTSLLFDAQGRLAVIYRGALDVDRLLEDVEVLGSTDDPDNTPLTGGRWFQPQGRDFGALAEVMEALGRERLAGYFEGLVRTK